jgi:HSP20 family protein
MSFIPWIERHPLAEFQSDFDSIFDHFFGHAKGREIEPWGLLRFRSPAVDMEENDKEVIVKAEMPGLKPNDFQISLDHNALTIKGEKKEEKKEEKKNYLMIERSYGSFYRSIPLPSEVDNDKVKATYNKGILEILLPKSKPHKAKKITINVK